MKTSQSRGPSLDMLLSESPPSSSERGSRRFTPPRNLRSRASTKSSPIPATKSGVYEKAVDRVERLLANEGILCQLLFVTELSHRPSPAELVDMVVEARGHNVRHHVTGVLLHKEGALLHALEGPESGVLAVYQWWCVDARRHQVTPLANRTIERRQYRALPLSFHNLDELEESGAPSVRSFASVPLTPSSLSGNPARAEQLLMAVHARS